MLGGIHAMAPFLLDLHSTSPRLSLHRHRHSLAEASLLEEAAVAVAATLIFVTVVDVLLLKIEALSDLEIDRRPLDGVAMIRERAEKSGVTSVQTMTVGPREMHVTEIRPGSEEIPQVHDLSLVQIL